MLVAHDRILTTRQADFPTNPHAKALHHARSLSAGPPLDPILTALAEKGVYLSQFVTGTGNGGLTAHPGGARWEWESRMFGGAYDDAPPEARPVYGALNFRHNPAGAAPRFGSAHFRLTPEADDQDALDDHIEAQVHAEIAVSGRLTPRILGEAARGGRYDEQALKRVWHYLARFGRICR
ncbi:DUF3626 domain-containing protein [Streptomyces sp. NPDC041003]|uniref:DUF3626 domain-containing protein n=1 Tax=Streptomyces sp. NPDC041003 TaxID=3155730 RepID=UPI003408B8E0